MFIPFLFQNILSWGSKIEIKAARRRHFLSCFLDEVRQCPGFVILYGSTKPKNRVFRSCIYTKPQHCKPQQEDHNNRQQTYISAKVFCFFALILSDVMTAFSSSDFLVWSNNVVCFNFPADCFALTGETVT